jgi:hypothetical protein
MMEDAERTVYEDGIESARDHYRCEPGTKRAVDTGEITMGELALSFCVYEYMSRQEDPGPKHFGDAISFVSNIPEFEGLEAKAVFDKVSKVKRVLLRSLFRKLII